MLKTGLRDFWPVSPPRWHKAYTYIPHIDYVDLTYPELLGGDVDHKNQGPDEIYDVFLMTKTPYRRVDLFRFGDLSATSPISWDFYGLSQSDLVKNISHGES